jgi:hypothetical protein
LFQLFSKDLDKTKFWGRHCNCRTDRHLVVRRRGRVEATSAICS